MKKSKSWTRYQYEVLYKMFRRFGDARDYDWSEPFPEEIIRAADYSYQAYPYNCTGWVNNRRRMAFKHLQAVNGMIKDLPF